jgi:hypothetical protein
MNDDEGQFKFFKFRYGIAVALNSIWADDGMFSLRDGSISLKFKNPAQVIKKMKRKTFPSLNDSLSRDQIRFDVHVSH